MRADLLVILILCCFGVNADAAYRVFKLKVTRYQDNGKKSSTSTILSTLDPIQYADWHGGYGWTKALVVDTWYCPGDTSRKKYCDKPKVIDRGPAAFDQPKRNNLPYNMQPVIP